MTTTAREIVESIKPRAEISYMSHNGEAREMIDKASFDRLVKCLEKAIEQRDLALILRDNTDMYDDATQKRADNEKLLSIAKGQS